MLHFLKGSIIRSFCNSQSSHLVLFNFFQKNKNKSWSIEFYFLQNQNKKVLLFLDKTWLKSSGWIAINWLLQKFLQMKRLIIALFFLDLVADPWKIRPWYPKFSSAFFSDFPDWLLHLLLGDTTIIVFIKKIIQNQSKIVPTTRVQVHHGQILVKGIHFLKKILAKLFQIIIYFTIKKEWNLNLFFRP